MAGLPWGSSLGGMGVGVVVVKKLGWGVGLGVPRFYLGEGRPSLWRIRHVHPSLWLKGDSFVCGIPLGFPRNPVVLGLTLLFLTMPEQTGGGHAFSTGWSHHGRHSTVQG